MSYRFLPYDAYGADFYTNSAFIQKGDWDASTGTFPGGGEAALGWFYRVSVAGTVNSISFTVGDSIFATVNGASSTVYSGNWQIIEGDVLASFVARDGSTPIENHQTIQGTAPYLNLFTPGPELDPPDPEYFRVVSDGYGGRKAIEVRVGASNPNAGENVLSLRGVGDTQLDRVERKAADGSYAVLLDSANAFSSVVQYGAIGDGTNHLLSGVYGTLAEAQAVYSFATALTQSLNWAAFQAAINSGKPVYIPAGDYYVPNDDMIVPPTGTELVIYGEGKHVSRIKFYDNPAISGQLFHNTSGAPVASVSWRDFAIEGQWTLDAEFDFGSHLSELYVTGNVDVRNCRFFGSRRMATVFSSGDSATVMQCDYDTITADGCRFRDFRSVNVSNNEFYRVNDDCVAIHTLDSAAMPLQSSATVNSNRIVDCQGIAILGPKMVDCCSNVITRPIVRAIQIGDEQSGTTEGNAPVVAINVADNVITDVFDGFSLTGAGGGTRRWIYIAVTVPLSDGSGYYIGTGNGAGGILKPYSYFYSNNTDAAGPGAGSWFINVTGNVCARTLTTAAHYSDYGFGERLGKLGFSDVAVTAGMIGGDQIEILNHGRNFLIANNNLTGGGRAVYLHGTASSAYLSWKNVLVANNIMGNFTTAAVNYVGEGIITIDGNMVDGDPFHESSERTAGGCWSSITPTHTAFRSSGGVYGIFNNNTIRNCGRVVAGSGNEYWGGGNRLFCNPVALGGSTSNVGIAYLDPPRIGTLHIEDGDPASSTYGKVLNICPTSASSIPSSGTFVQGHVVMNSQPSRTVAVGWVRLTTGSSHAIGTDWLPLPPALYDATSQHTTFNGLTLSARTFATLPTAVAGMINYITDCNTTTWGATAAGGGSNKVIVFYNGTNWTVAGK